MFPIQIKNFDEYMTKSKKYINKHPLAPKWPFRLLICGDSGCGKTNLFMNLIFSLLHFNKLYIYTKMLNEDKYEFINNFFELIDHMIDEKLNKKAKKLGKNYAGKTQTCTISNDINDLVPLEDICTDEQNLIIFDDMLLEKDQSMVEDYFMRGRKYNASFIYLSQSYFKTPRFIRLNCTDFMLFPSHNKKELNMIQQVHATRLTKDQFMSLFEEINKTPFNFMFIATREKNPMLWIRSGIDGLYTGKTSNSLEKS